MATLTSVQQAKIEDMENFFSRHNLSSYNQSLESWIYSIATSDNNEISNFAVNQYDETTDFVVTLTAYYFVINGPSH